MSDFFQMWVCFLTLAAGLALGGFFISQTGVNSAREQHRISMEEQLEFIRALQASGIQVQVAPEHEGPTPPTKG